MQNIMYDGRPFYYREDKWDLGIFEDVNIKDEYKLKELPHQKIVVDIGAHIGSFTRLAISLWGSQVISFEPYPPNYELLAKNTEGLNAKVFNCGIGFEKTTARFAVVEGGNTGGHRVDPKGQSIVDILPFSFIWKLTSHIDLLKVDAEGAEEAVFQNDLSSIPIIVGEFHGSKAMDAMLAVKSHSLQYFKHPAGDTMWDVKGSFRMQLK